MNQKPLARRSPDDLQEVDAGTVCQYDTPVMTAIAKKLDARLNRWAPETAKRVKQLVAEIIELADHDALDLVRSRKVEQEVLDIIDGRQSRVRFGSPIWASPQRLVLFYPSRDDPQAPRALVIYRTPKRQRRPYEHSHY